MARNVKPDDVVRQRMFGATNGPKVRDLHEGNWQKHYPPPQGSQSQADFALIDMIAFLHRQPRTMRPHIQRIGIGRAE